jgi:hypothetical protein
LAWYEYYDINWYHGMNEQYYLDTAAELGRGELKDFCLHYLKQVAEYYELDLALNALCMVSDEMGDL